MKSLILGAALATVAGIAVAQTVPPPTPAPTPAKADRKFQRIDANRDGVVTREEAQAQADRKFDRIDTDRDGRITAAERSAMHEKMQARRAARGIEPPAPPPGGPKHAPGMGRGADPDRDGVITREEWRARAVRHFDRVDTNRDGRIDAAEQAAAPRRHHRPPASGATPVPPPPNGTAK